MLPQSIVASNALLLQLQTKEANNNKNKNANIIWQKRETVQHLSGQIKICSYEYRNRYCG